MRPILIATAAMVMLGMAAARAEDAAGCAKFKWSIGREQAAFSAPGLPSIGSGQVLPPTGASVALQPQDTVAFAKPPARKPKVEPAFAAVLSLPLVAAAGTYEVTLSDEAWIDVVQNGTDIKSSGFSGQPDCPGVRKSVKFALQPGQTTVQISGASIQTIKVEVLGAE